MNTTIDPVQIEPSWLSCLRKDALFARHSLTKQAYRKGLTLAITPPLPHEYVYKKTKGQSMLESNIPNSAPKPIPSIFESNMRTSMITQAHAEHHAHARIYFFSLVEEDTQITLSSSSEQQFTTLLLDQKKNASLTLYLRGRGYHSIMLFGQIKKNLTINIIQQQDPTGMIDLRSYFSLQDHAKLILNEAHTGAKYCLSEQFCTLIGESSSSKQTQVFLGQAKQRYDLLTSCTHRGKYTTSILLNKGALLDNAHCLVNGKIHIEKDADFSSAQETQACLLSSKNAQAGAMPDLDIHNHNVSCHHGTSIGNVDENALFYLMSRGLSKADAIRSIIKGYFSPMKLHKEIKEHIETTLENIP